MIRRQKIGISIPAYNEAGFITKTLQAVPDYVDVIVCIDDASRDSTYREMQTRAAKDKRVIVLHNQRNHGVGYSVKRGLKRLLQAKVDYLVIAPGDNQCDLKMIKAFVEVCEGASVDICRGNRFLNRQEISQMPGLRRLGNSLYSFISKFVSGYYSLFDFQSSFGVYRRRVMQALDFASVRDDYLFENSLWTELNIVGAKIKEVEVPVIYAGEVSGINYFNFVSKSMGYLLPGLFHRIFNKYILILHPLGIFFVAGLLLFFWGLCFGLFVAIDSLGSKTATTATVMLSVVPFITGFQLLLQAIVLDIQNEPR